MGTKNSVPVTSTQYESHATTGPAPSAVASARGDHELTGSVGKLSIATIRPHDGAGRLAVMAAPGAVTPLDIKITNALKELKRKQLAEEKEIHHDPFTRIMLKFPLVATAFNSVRSTFEELDKGKKGYIVYTDMEEAFERLGVNFSKEEMGQVFQESDMLENGRLNFKEFLVCLAIGFVLHKIPSLESRRLSIFYAPMNPTDKDKDDEAIMPVQSAMLFGEGNKLRVAFQLAIDAFLWFDVDGNGQINRDEMASRLNSSTTLHSPTKKTSTHRRDKPAITRESSMNGEIWERRFSEMDWNNDGTIHFKEFLMAFESWVGLDDDESS